MSEEKRKCPVCAEEIPVDATVCKFCGEKLSASSKSQVGGSVKILELYNPKTAALWSLLFTPVFGAFVTKSNWKNLGQEQLEKRSKTWLIALTAIYIISILFLNEGICSSLYLLTLVAWYFIECRPQIQYLTENKIDYQKKNWKSLAPKAAGILIGAWILFMILFVVIGNLFGGPTLDYSSSETYRKSCKEIMVYLAEEIGGKEFGKKLQNNDLTEEEEKILAQVIVLGVFLDSEHDENLKEAIDGMSAYELLDFVNENYYMDVFGELHQKE